MNDVALFAERFKEAREKSGLTLKELKERVGVSISALSHYANGANLPPLDVASKIAKELKVSLDWLCGLESDAPAVDRAELNNCADAVRYLRALHHAFGGSTLSLARGKVVPPEGPEDEVDAYYVNLSIPNQHLYDYFEQRQAMLNMYNKLKAPEDQERMGTVFGVFYRDLLRRIGQYDTHGDEWKFCIPSSEDNVQAMIEWEDEDVPQTPEQ